MRWFDDLAESIVDNYLYSRTLSKELSQYDPFEDFLARLLMFGKIEVEDWDRESGKYFGIPKCCIEWFIALDKMGIHNQGEYMDQMYGADDLEKYGYYVRCPKCRNEHPSPRG